ncbi:hypothetical protein SAY87_017147 [Trapa incisa]|uniref:Uncharacterized protein n=1 Tax=Trapa incisa TaxID=236973 RepID=A0AAN7LI24_9MYRT|nr:hypothetical protein SAY87_017147 [Trapa incisa]
MEINLWERPGPNGNSNADEGGCEEHDLGWSRVDPPDDRNGKNEANMDMLQSSGGQSMCGCRIHEFTHPSSVLKTVEPESTSCGGYCSNGNHIQVQGAWNYIGQPGTLAFPAKDALDDAESLVNVGHRNASGNQRVHSDAASFLYCSA